MSKPLTIRYHQPALVIIFILFEMINSSFATLTFVEKHPAMAVAKNSAG